MVTDQKILHFLESKNADEQNLPFLKIMLHSCGLRFFLHMGLCR